MSVLRTPAAAQHCGLSVSTFEKMRLRGDGPPFIRLTSRAVGYEEADLDQWLQKRQRAFSTSDIGGRS